LQRLIRNVQITDVYGPFHFEDFLMANKPTYEELEQRVQKLEESERELVFRSKQLESLMNNNTFGIVSLDKDMRIVGCNEAFEHLFLYARSEMEGKTLDELIVGGDQRGKANAYTKTTLTGKCIQGLGQRRRKDGALINVKFSGIPITVDGVIKGAYGIYEDITAITQAEGALRESEERYRTLVDNLPVAVNQNAPGPKGAFLMANPAFCKMFGFKNEEELKKLAPADIYPNPEERKQYSDNLIQKGVLKDYERTLLKKDGTPVHTSITSRVVHGNDGEVSHFDSIMLDITDQKRVEEALRESEEKFRLISEQSLLAIGIIQDGCIIYANEMYSKITGYSLKEIYGWEPYGYARTVHKDDLSFVMRQSRKKQAGDTDVLTNYRLRGFTKSKNIVWWDLYSRTVAYHGRPADLFTFVDITERVKSEKDRQTLQTQLHQAQKMEAIGMLAGGVAHDLNNILGGLVSYPELLLLQLPEDSPLRKSILTIQKSGEKAAAVVQDLLTLARRGVVVTEVVNLNDVIVEFLKSPEYERLQSYHPGVHIETHLETDILNILGSSTHLSKTVMNLVSNAAEAMPEEGEMTVSTENRYIDKPIKGHDHVKEGDYVVLIISDTGTGISPDDMEKIFEPFYTKKKMGRSGTGLGMAVVWGTVKDHNGYIHVQSAEGKGTTFTLHFPVTRKSIEERSEISQRDYTGKGETILVVDDVEEQRNIASGMLKELGYSVASVSSGEEAVEYLKANKADLLLLDMIMDPGMDGLDTYKNILETHSGQKAIIASGFSETDRVKEVLSLGAGAYIKKPFLLEKIGLAVKEELEK
jgi:PAS domain S-box-containing protein